LGAPLHMVPRFMIGRMWISVAPLCDFAPRRPNPMARRSVCDRPCGISARPPRPRAWQASAGNMEDPTCPGRAEPPYPGAGKQGKSDTRFSKHRKCPARRPMRIEDKSPPRTYAVNCPAAKPESLSHVIDPDKRRPRPNRRARSITTKSARAIVWEVSLRVTCARFPALARGARLPI
jgi:hypothetical protein